MKTLTFTAATLLFLGTCTKTATATNFDDSITDNVKRSFINPVANETFFVIKECTDTNNEYTLLQVEAPVDTKTPFHHHNHYDEYMKVVKGTFHTTIDGKNRTYVAGESFVFPKDVTHRWWTGADEPATVTVQTMPCADGFHESIEIYSRMSPKERENLGMKTKAILYNIGGTNIHTTSWLEQCILWICCQWAQTRWGLQFELELREKYLSSNIANNNEESTDREGPNTGGSASAPEEL